MTIKVFLILYFFFSCTNRIIAMCGDYYIGGRRFSSLSDLIGYYSHVSCLLKGEKLLYPVAPPEASKMSFKTWLFHFTNRISSCSDSRDVYYIIKDLILVVVSEQNWQLLLKEWFYFVFTRFFIIRYDDTLTNIS